MKCLRDKIDARIIVFLQQDGRMSYTKIAKELALSETTVRNRAQKLINDGVFQIVAVCDPQKIGFAISGNIWLDINPRKSKQIVKELSKIKEIWYIAINTGRVDINLVFNSNSLEDLEKLIFEKINIIDGVLKSETSIIVSYKKRNYSWGTSMSQKDSS